MDIETQVLVELIKAGGHILTATIPSLTTFVVGKKIIKNAKLKENYLIALNDIRYLLGVEALHCREHTERDGKPLKQTIRNAVTAERNLEWSGKNTQSQVIRRIEKLK
ncbi:hypothetical protein R7D97_16320 [Vibrio sp. Vb5031]|uniref:hypothetical protein n=1 Tax=Vibrio TaxID=662 RepID=UPI0006A96F3C|nr:MULTISPECIES: hypothetical protein [Vibrio]HBC3404777.1 hypothetical protein [Vibrio parahaemolyticus]MDW1505749.1 hypothetical protein [Vibrio sp. Vb5031]MDW1517470.1 hypothetical protein [Vibrio sp. Vb5035]MDW1547599.1 hypothetical protein [Vibrio sp. Vb5034]MDW2456211.1 hypothetical protein [Vibrio sp. 1249-1]